MIDTRPEGADGGARKFFEGYARSFDHIYDDDGKSPLRRFVDVRLRKEMRLRFSKAFEVLAPMRGHSLLDAGCGGGRYAIPAAEAGASHVLGLDFSESMLDLARDRARTVGVERVCEFAVGDLLTYPLPPTGFDYALAIGFFDYPRDPAAALNGALDQFLARAEASCGSKALHRVAQAGMLAAQLRGQCLAIAMTSPERSPQTPNGQPASPAAFRAMTLSRGPASPALRSRRCARCRTHRTRVVARHR